MTASSRIAGLILAGGQGQRMGHADKAFLPLGGRALIGHAIARLGPQTGPLAISANGDAARFAAFDLPVLSDEAQGQGPLAGVLAGLFWAQSVGASALVTCAVDTPFIPADLVARLCAAQSSPEHAVYAVAAGRAHPTVTLWPLSLAAQVRDALTSGRRGLYRLLDPIAQPVDFGATDAFYNINTPEDLIAAERIYAELAR